MPKKNEAWGVEVGANAIKAVKLLKHGAVVHLEDYEVIRFKQILTTPDIDADEQIQVALEQASRADERIAAGDAQPLTGIPTNPSTTATITGRTMAATRPRVRSPKSRSLSSVTWTGAGRGRGGVRLATELLLALPVEIQRCHLDQISHDDLQSGEVPVVS